MDIAPSLFKLTRLKRLTVAQAMDSDRWMTGLHRITSTDQLHEFTALWIRLQGLELTNEDDQIAWNLNANAKYSSASAYDVQFAGAFSPIDFSKLWRSKAQPKCKMFFWLWLRQRILTDDNLQLRGIDHGDKCSLCDQEQETATHLVLNCPFARSVWHLLAQWANCPGLFVMPMQFENPAAWWHFMASSLRKDELLITIYGAWHLWKERCRRVFQQAVTSEAQLLDFIRDDLLLVGSFLHDQAAVPPVADSDVEDDDGE